MLYHDIHEVLNKRKKLNENDPRLYNYWDMLILVLTSDIERTIRFLNQGSENDVLYISEVFEEVAFISQSVDFIQCIESLILKFPKAPLTHSVRAAKDFIRCGQSCYIIDFYKEYIGEPMIEIVSFANKKMNIKAQIWVGFFDDIMMSIEPSKNGWSGLLLDYHLHTGMYEESPQLLENPEEVAIQLREINKDILKFGSSIELIEILILLLNSSWEGKLYISYV